MSELQMSLTEEETQLLVEILETVLKDARIEEHRTRSPLYRESIVKKEKTVLALLDKLGQHVG